MINLENSSEILGLIILPLVYFTVIICACNLFTCFNIINNPPLNKNIKKNHKWIVRVRPGLHTIL